MLSKPEFVLVSENDEKSPKTSHFWAYFSYFFASQIPGNGYVVKFVVTYLVAGLAFAAFESRPNELNSTRITIQTVQTKV